MYFPSHFKKHQAVILPAPYLNGQDRGVLRPMPYGLRTVGNVGCGPISLYNAMIYLGMKPDFTRILRYMELTSTPLVAAFGTFPFSMGYCLRHFGVQNRMTRSRKKLAAAQCGILAFWTKRPIFSGGHFVFYVKQENGTYIVYNRYSNVEHPVEYNSLDEVMRPHCLIVGYVIR